MNNYVRIVILNFNCARLTIDLVAMIQQQIYDSFEVIVVDNASESEDFSLLLESLPPQVYLIRSEINLGYSGGNNLGLRYDSGSIIDYFLILNNDLVIKDKFFIKKMVEGFHIFDHKTIIATSPLVDTISSNQSVDTQIQVRKLLKPFQLYLISFSFFKKIFPRLYKEFIYFNYMPFSNKYFICDTINGAAFMISKKFIDSINYFDQNVFLYHEELILGKQIKNCGGECLLNGFIEVKHIQGSSTKSTPLNFNLAMERYKYISEAYFFKQYLDVKDIYIKIFCGLKKLELGIKKFIFSFR